MDLSAILSDKPAPVRTEAASPPPESAKDEKPAVDEPSPLEAAVREEREPAAPSAAQEPEKEKPEAEKSAEPEKAAEVEAESESETARERDEKGRFIRTVPHEAFHAERMKRQEAERQLAAQKAAAAKPPTSVLENEDQAFSERLSIAMRPWQERFFKLSVKTARNVPSRTDYEEVSEAFMQAAEQDKRLEDAFRESDDPGEYIYAVGKQLKELAAFGGDIVQYGEKKRSEGAGDTSALKAEIKALKAKVKAFEESQDRKDKIPQSLNGEQSSPVGSGATAFTPPALRDIINVKS